MSSVNIIMPRILIKSINSAPFELVYSEIWGLYCFSSFKSFKYIHIFMDDFSPITWLYLLKERCIVPHNTELLHTEVKTQFSTSICILRIDNAIEYIKYYILFLCYQWNYSPNIIFTHVSTEWCCWMVRCYSHFYNSHARSKVFVVWCCSMCISQ